jgi:Fic family protein
MNPTEFTSASHGRVIHTAQGYFAYIPSPLEPEIQLDLELMRTLSDADRSISELAGVARRLPNPHLLIGPFIRREAVLSSRIEGTQASLSDLLFFEAANLRETEVPDVREVANYVRALEHGLTRLNELPLSLRLIREMHERLMTGVRGGEQTPGEFRRSQNWIGPPGCTLMDATFVPPPVDEMNNALYELEKYLHSASPLPTLIRLSMIHYQFETIHPFLDGNGRIGRLLVTLLLCTEGVLSQPLLYLSAFFERHRAVYYDHLLAVSQKGQWTDWIKFFLRAVTAQSKDAIVRSDRLLALWQNYRERLQAARSSALLLLLVDNLFQLPVITNTRAVEKLAVTPRSAQLNIDKLVAAGILREVTGNRRNRVYIADEIFHITGSEA